ncbi:MAG: response regulator [bacterium]|nr:response regulator [bacterium]
MPTTRVLLVEDEEAHAELIQLSFDSEAEVHLTVASSLEQARAYFAESPPDLAIVDSLLPDGRGIELVTEQSNTSGCAFILLTSHADETMEAEAMALGAARYMVKSELTLLEMPATVDSTLREWRREHENPEKSE